MENTVSIENSRAIGRLEASIQLLLEAFAQLRAEFQADALNKIALLKEHKSDLHGLLQEVRDRHHAQMNAIQTSILQMERRLLLLEQAAAHRRGVSFANAGWFAAISSLLSAAAAAAVTFLANHLGSH